MTVVQEPDRAARPERIDFIIAGAQKAGTTALARYLSQHPDIFIPVKKEFHWFKRPISFQGGIDDLPVDRFHRHFEGALGRKICGEASPAYLYWPRAAQLISEYRRDIKIVVSLRNPVLRAYSAWSMERRRGREPLGFLEAVTKGRARVAAAEGGVHAIYSYAERGFYSAQIETLLKYFDRGQIFFLRADEIAAASRSLSRLTAFLGAEPHNYRDIRENLMPGSLPVENSAELESAFQTLFELYADDMSRLSAMTGLDVSDWLAGPPQPPPAAPRNM